MPHRRSSTTTIAILGPDTLAEDILEAMRSTPKAAAIPVFSLSAALKQALLDELAASASWRSLLEELVHEIEAALRIVAASAGALPLDGGEAA